MHGADGTTLFDPLVLRPVPDPVMLVPESGRLEGLSTAVRWEPAPADAGTRVRLTLHGWRTATVGERPTRSGEGRATTLRCLLVDDGEFLVPAAPREEIDEASGLPASGLPASGLPAFGLPASGRWTVRLARERRTLATRDGSRLEVVQLVLPES